MQPRSTLLAILAAAAIGLAGCTATVTVPSRDGPWTAECLNVATSDCDGIARMFLNNLAANGGWVRDESSGRLQISVLSACPGFPAWAMPGTCWRAAARTQSARACIIVARRKESEQGFVFG